MKSIIEEIYFGNRGNNESIKISEEYKKAYGKYFKLFEDILKELPESSKAKMDELFLASSELESEADLMHFKEGFKLGLLVAFEAHE